MDQLALRSTSWTAPQKRRTSTDLDFFRPALPQRTIGCPPGFSWGEAAGGGSLWQGDARSPKPGGMCRGGYTTATHLGARGGGVRTEWAGTRSRRPSGWTRLWSRGGCPRPGMGRGREEPWTARPGVETPHLAEAAQSTRHRGVECARHRTKGFNPACTPSRARAKRHGPPTFCLPLRPTLPYPYPLSQAESNCVLQLRRDPTMPCMPAPAD